jgi:hypothetical protein
LAITLVIAYSMDWNLTLRKVQHAFDKVDNLLFSHIEC